ncbi:SAM-dependent DNA methyltransferase [Xanthomonas arboricola pv. juglandis]|uniref:N-6 DNA methylase n=1 Tax=Xanthomonas arboricola TaxID=56448 RepID=UPI001AF08AED|nr:N-6 DNA methylase [Xanthomonas arboricola]CAG2082209.1 SAM-dependent DNA methyltransferase [Xanthomonas arboricola pv. juglandis]
MTVTDLRRKSSDRLGRYYTAHEVGQLLVSQMKTGRPKTIIDLGAGGGALAVAAANRWNESDILTIDVDGKSVEMLGENKQISGRYQHIRVNALDTKLPERIRVFSDSVDVGVCNPPFIMPKWRKDYLEILKSAGFNKIPSVNRYIEAPALFFAQNMRILSDGGQLGIILPDSLISSARYRWFREELLEKYRINKVIRLPRGSFTGTDALAYIITLEKNSPGKNIQLSSFDGTSVADKCLVSKDEAAIRMDGEFHCAGKIERKIGKYKHTLQLDSEAIRRGSFENAIVAKRGCNVLHTKDLLREDLGKWVHLDPIFQETLSRLNSKSAVIAGPGDILIARVGRNLDEKVIGVASGYAYITDCIYRIRVPIKFRSRLLSALSSELGRAWIAANSYGVSARQLPKSALMGFEY